MRKFGGKLSYLLVLAACLALLPFRTGAEEGVAMPEETAAEETAFITDAQLPEETEEREEPAAPEETEPPFEEEEDGEDAAWDEDGESFDEPFDPGEPSEPVEPAEPEVPAESVPEQELFPCGETLFWSVSEDGTLLTFTGSGAMSEYESAAAVPWAGYKETVTSIVLPEKLTSISTFAFSGFSALKEITVPAGVRSIGQRAFENCALLASVTFTGDWPAFGEEVFAGDALTVFYPAVITLPEEMPFGEGITLCACGTEEEETGTEETEEEHFFPEILLNRDYIKLEPGETFLLIAEPNFVPENGLAFSLEGDAVSLLEGTVRAEECGIAYITVSASYEGKTYAAVCCAEVVKTAPAVTGISDILLITASKEVELLKTDYAEIKILPVMSLSMSPDSDTESIDLDGVLPEKAVFTNAELNKLFTLRVKDSETLQIVPTDFALEAAKAPDKKIKKTYVTGITVTAGGVEFTPYESLKLKVRNTKPAIKAASIVFNSYPSELGKKIPFTFTGGTVTACTLLNDPPAWLEFDGTHMTAALSPTYVPDKYTKGKLVLSCEVEGWAVPAEATVKYSGKSVTPKLSLSEKNVTLFAGTGDTARIRVKLGPEEYADAKAYPVTLKGIDAKTEKGYTPAENGTRLKAELKDGELTVSAPVPAEEEHTYRITLSALDKAFYCYVRVPASDSVPKPSLKTSGGIEAASPGSAFVIEPVKKNFRKGGREEYALTAIVQYKGKTLVSGDVSDLFTVTKEGDRFLLREKTPGSVPAGYTYRAVITLTTAAGEASSAVTVKISFASKETGIKAAVKAEGSLSLNDSDARILLTPSVRPRGNGEELSLAFFKKKGETPVELEADECPFTPEKNADGTYTLRLTGKTEPGTLYYVQLRVCREGKTYASNAVKLSVKR